jgi:hypothetical protein
MFWSQALQLRDHMPLSLNNDPISRGQSHKHLGIIIDETLTCPDHINSSVVKCNNQINPLRALMSSLRSIHLERLYF